MKNDCFKRKQYEESRIVKDQIGEAATQEKEKRTHDEGSNDQLKVTQQRPDRY